MDTQVTTRATSSEGKGGGGGGTGSGGDGAPEGGRGEGRGGGGGRGCSILREGDRFCRTDGREGERELRTLNFITQRSTIYLGNTPFSRNLSLRNQHTRELISTRKTSHKHKQQRPESPAVTLIIWHAYKL